MAATVGSISCAGASLLLSSASGKYSSNQQACFRKLKGEFAALSLSIDSVAGSKSSAASRLSAGVARAAVTAPPTQYKTLKPLGDRVLVKIQASEEKSDGGIILPTTTQTKPQSGEVVEVGEGKKIGEKSVPSCVTVGNTIVYSKYAGTEIQFNGADHILLKEDDVIGLLSTEDIKDLKPVNDRVLIKVAEAEDKTAGGVLLTDSVKEKPVIGEVVAVGPGSYGEDGTRKPLEVSIGDNVLYSKYAGNEFKNKDNSQYVVMRVSDLLAILS
ncbi:hypothetical protein SELMODRAFT_147159 [Selaginella moellendorffii]|uniref:20 kDa chaperonin, chloroplastic n=1 Tax=Selaginella moellendorffii TaxID=88036 RepID=D8RH41_SELML|nr:20 kDa chaperonin, chloroplastic isoform X1 [Selaginella moellendorffii]EFJ28704.1 hypothetical protein SELMODRAFT_147159 [Selaginella moellendorffii]|eukprot:XP_002970574.1 20 kDa chaperonin, chloroplastic isoform X1 [Selaginella moellendorffii]